MIVSDEGICHQEQVAWWAAFGLCFTESKLQCGQQIGAAVGPKTSNKIFSRFNVFACCGNRCRLERSSLIAKRDHAKSIFSFETIENLIRELSKLTHCWPVHGSTGIQHQEHFSRCNLRRI